MSEVYIIDAVRTPRGIGKAGKGSLSHLHPQQLAAQVMSALVERNGLDPALIDDVIWGTNTQVGKQASNMGRMAALLAGFPETVSGVTLDRACGAGITATSLAAGSIGSGNEDAIIAGGAEMMSYTNSLPADGYHFANRDADLLEMHPLSHQGVAADAIAASEGIDRAALDDLALKSQQRAGRAMEEGRFDKSVIPVKNPDGSVALAKDEFPRPQTTAETLAGLKPSFDAIADMAGGQRGATPRGEINRRYPDLHWQGVHHAGNSSGVVDGAAAILLTSKEFAEAHGLKPRARVVAYANVGGDPTLMLNAPVPAARKVLAKAGLSVSDIDVWEVNEAFAVVVEKVIRDLGLDREKVNVNGGAIALGHPIGATGAILIGSVIDELERSGGRYGLATMCAAGGLAPAIIVERL